MFQSLHAGSFHRTHLGIIGALSLLTTYTVWRQPSQTADQLAAGQTFTRSLAGGKTHTYSVDLVTGQFLHIVVEQQGIDLIVKIVRAGGETIAQVDRPNGLQGPEAISLVAQESGAYRILVSPASNKAPAGDYRLTLHRLRQSQPIDQTRIEAEQAVSKGEILRVKQTVEAKREAIGQFERALGIWRTLGESYEEAVALYGLGLSHREIGENRTAANHFKRALDIMRSLGDHYGEAINQTGLAWSYLYLGATDKALDNFSQSLRLRHIINDRSGETLTLYGIGWAHANRGDPQKALDYFLQVLRLRRELGDRRGEAVALVGIGQIYGQLQRQQEALSYLHQALALTRELGNRYLEADALDKLGWTSLALNEVSAANDYFQQALPMRRMVGDRMGEATALFGLARIECRQGRLLAARDRMEASLALIESSRTEAAIPQFRATFFASVIQYYQFAIKILMRLHEREPSSGYAAMALRMSERMRARSLLDLLAEARSEAPAHLLESERTLNLADLQQHLLDDNTLLLEYSLGEECSYLWAVTSTSLDSYALPGRNEIESAVRRLLSLIDDGKRRAARQTIKPDQAIQSFNDAAAPLSQMLLGPVAAQLKNKRLVIVADGALQYAPFAALPAPTGTVHPAGDDPEVFTPYRPLVADHEIVSLPSASVLASLRRQLDGRPTAPKTIAVFADPVFEITDPRVNITDSRKIRLMNAGRAGQINAATTDADSAPARLLRLPFTRRAASAIIPFVAPDQRLLALDFAASRATATSAELAQYRIIHFATHSLLNQEHPELSGIALSLVDERGRPQDGFLRLRDIYNLKLRADLVALSACRTGLGKEIKGEGLIGLTRGFMYAGAPRVVATLWKVDDKATAELMKRFYQALLGERHMRPAAALRAAQIALWRQKRWRDPAYWAAFTLQGEWQ